MTDDICKKYLDSIRNNDVKVIEDISRIIEITAKKWTWLDHGAIDDITQDCFLKLINNLQNNKFKGESTLKTYIYSLTRYTCLDYYKSKVRRKTVPVEDEILIDSSPNADKSLEEVEKRKMARKILMALPAECRKIWYLVFFKKRNYRQTAEKFGISEGSIKRKMWECRQKARKMLEMWEL